MINKRNDKWTGRKFKVTVHLPDVVSESVRQSKIDRLYDILKAANAKKTQSRKYRVWKNNCVNTNNPAALEIHLQMHLIKMLIDYVLKPF